MTIELFNDEAETIQVDNVSKKLFDYIGVEKEEFYNDAYNNQSLGAILYDNTLLPLTQAIQRSFFLISFSQIIDSFRIVGTFENYLTILHSIFGDDAVIEFTRTAPANLQIDILTSDLSEVVNTYSIIGSDGSNITGYAGENAFQLIGYDVLPTIQNRELSAILRACAPAGIYVTFTIGAL